MAFMRIDGGIGGQPIDEVSTTQQHPFGFKVRAYDATYGFGDFVYAKGVSSGIAGAVCTYVPSSGVTALGAAGSQGQVGVMVGVMDAATKFGWLQVGGVAQVKTAGDVADGKTVYLTATAGAVDDAVTAGDIVYGATFAAARTGAGLVSASLSGAPYVGHTDNS